LSKVANHPVKVVCAGCTDTGVHAMILIEFIIKFNKIAKDELEKGKKKKKKS